jgi:hypothetical protein
MKQAHRAEKWPRFSLTRTSGSAFNDALVKVSKHRIDPKSANPLLGSML